MEEAVRNQTMSYRSIVSVSTLQELQHEMKSSAPDASLSIELRMKITNENQFLKKQELESLT
jgi:hypothetical protein